MRRGIQVLGVYVQKAKTAVGVGRNQAVTVTTTYWFVRQLSNARYEIQPLNSSHAPSGMAKVIDRDELIQNFNPEPRYYERYASDFMASLLRKIRQAGTVPLKNTIDTQEMLLCRAVLAAEPGGKGKAASGISFTGEELKTLLPVLENLLRPDQEFKVEQSQRINNLGIDLRKSGRHLEAISYYMKAQELDPDDEHLLFNIGRAYYESGDIDSCITQMANAVSLNPDFAEARRALAFCKRKSAEDKLRNGK